MQSSSSPKGDNLLQGLQTHNNFIIMCLKYVIMHSTQTLYFSVCILYMWPMEDAAISLDYEDEEHSRDRSLM